MDKKLTQSLEAYLLAIDELLKLKSEVIVKDVSEFLKIGAPSTAEAIKKLKVKGYVNYEPYGKITLSEKGKEKVTMKKYRHNTIAKFLNKVLDIELKSAEDNATAIEYSMTEDVLSRFVNFVDFMEQCVCAEPRWVKSCKNSLSEGQMSVDCKSCISNSQNNGTPKCGGCKNCCHN